MTMHTVGGVTANKPTENKNFLKGREGSGGLGGKAGGRANLD